MMPTSLLTKTLISTIGSDDLWALDNYNEEAQEERECAEWGLDQDQVNSKHLVGSLIL